MYRLIAALLLLAVPVRADKLLIIAESVTWGCVGVCAEEDVADSYLPKLRAALPSWDIRALAWFGSGVADWEPEAASVSTQGLSFPDGLDFGIGEIGAGARFNLWSFLARPHLRDFEPDYTLVFLGFADGPFRVLRPGNPPALTEAQFEGALYRISRSILYLGSTPVLVFNTTGNAANAAALDPYFNGYRAAMARVCNGTTVLCGPDAFEYTDRTAHFVGTDGIHQNAAGHVVIADELAAFFLNRVQGD